MIVLPINQCQHYCVSLSNHRGQPPGKPQYVPEPRLDLHTQAASATSLILLLRNPNRL
jgi:hypothetical protein